MQLYGCIQSIEQGSMPPFIQPTAFFSPLSPAPASSSSPPYPPPVRPQPSSPSHSAAASYPLPPSPTSTTHLPSQSSIHTAVYSLPSTNMHSQYIHPLSTSTFRIHPTTTSSSNVRVPIAKRKPEGPEVTMELAEPQRKVRII